MNEHAKQLLLQIWVELRDPVNFDTLSEPCLLAFQEIDDYLHEENLVRDGELTKKGERILY